LSRLGECARGHAALKRLRIATLALLAVIRLQRGSARMRKAAGEAINEENSSFLLLGSPKIFNLYIDCISFQETRQNQQKGSKSYSNLAHNNNSTNTGSVNSINLYLITDAQVKYLIEVVHGLCRYQQLENDYRCFEEVLCSLNVDVVFDDFELDHSLLKNILNQVKAQKQLDPPLRQVKDDGALLRACLD